jgi:voltage-gated potassium channel Kch
MQYLFDNIMAAGTPAMIGMLVLLSLVIIVLAGAFLALTGISQDGQPLSFGEAAWEALMRTLDAGTMGGDTGLAFRLVMFAVTLGGVFIVSSLIGVLSTGVEAKLEELRKGRSVVLETRHTVILGWAPQVFTIISELVEANSNQKDAAIAILADKDKVEMEDEIRARVPDTKTTRIICRSGSPIDPTDLEIVSPHDARSIVVLPQDEEDPDSFVIKTILAITNNPNRREEPYTIVTQIQDEQNQSVIRMIGQRDYISALLTSDLIARVTAQTSRQSGLSVVYTELLDFGGDEIYFTKEETLVGKAFGEILNAYATSTVIGIYTADGKTLLNPAMDTKIKAGDRLIVIAADDDAIHLAGEKPVVAEKSIATHKAVTEPKPERGLILDWNESAPTIIRELDNYVAKGSTITVVADGSFEAEALALEGLANQELIFHAGDTTDRALLDELNIQDYDHVIVLADTTMDVQKADARTLVTLLHLRDIAEKDETPFSIVSEMLDLRNRKLAEVANVDDFIVSEHLISLMLTQLSENRDLHDVFTDLFSPEGSEIYLKPVVDYISIGQPVNFYTVTEAARRRGETALGYRIVSEARDQSKSYGVRTNPKKSDTITFTADDKVIVLAES